MVKILSVLRKINEGFQVPYACASEDSSVKPEPRVFFLDFCDVSVNKINAAFLPFPSVIFFKTWHSCNHMQIL